MTHLPSGGRGKTEMVRIPSLIAPGDTAPDFTLPDQHGNPVSLSELRGQTVVLYFYPKADT
jgi:peroxiredoxin